MSRTRLSDRLGYFVLYPKTIVLYSGPKSCRRKLHFFHIYFIFILSAKLDSADTLELGSKFIIAKVQFISHLTLQCFMCISCFGVKYKCRTFWWNTLYLKKGLEISLCHLLLLSQKCWTLYREPWYFCINEKVDSKNFSR